MKNDVIFVEQMANLRSSAKSEKKKKTKNDFELCVSEESPGWNFAVFCSLILKCYLCMLKACASFIQKALRFQGNVGIQTWYYGFCINRS